MAGKRLYWCRKAAITIMVLWIPATLLAGSFAFQDQIYDPGQLKPRDSRLKIRIGQSAPEFELSAVDGARIRLSQYRGVKNVVISFIPAAWTPVCSDQWPGYNLAQPLFDRHDTQLLGISVDNRATLHAWTRKMGNLWFPVLSDFWPHGAVADRYGVLRTDGTAERALIFVDKDGIIFHVIVADINQRPRLETIAEQLEKMAPAK